MLSARYYCVNLMSFELFFWRQLRHLRISLIISQLIFKLFLWGRYRVAFILELNLFLPLRHGPSTVHWMPCVISKVCAFWPEGLHTLPGPFWVPGLIYLSAPWWLLFPRNFSCLFSQISAYKWANFYLVRLKVSLIQISGALSLCDLCYLVCCLAKF